VSSGQAQISRLIDQRTERNRGPVAMALKHHPGILSLILESAGPRDHVKQVFARRLRRDAARRAGRRCVIYFAEDGDERGILGHQRVRRETGKE
jgi:hypothetical protein